MKCGNDEPKLPSSRRQAGQRRKEDDMHDIETTEYADSFFLLVWDCTARLKICRRSMSIFDIYFREKLLPVESIRMHSVIF